jgi:hypothetical protein
MSNNWINWRFGCWHLHIGPDERFWIGFHKNQYWADNKPERWFERY